MVALDAFTPAPTQPDSFLHYSKPIDQPEADKSKAIAIKGLGEAGEDLVKGVDKTLGEHAEFLGRELGEQEQTDFLNATKAVNESLTKPQDNVPQPVKDGLNYIDRNQSAYGQGKVRETEYYRNLYEKAKNLRTQWPGYRDYIDRGVEKATGITPNANQYIKSLLAEINEATSKTNKVADHINTKLIDAADQGITGAKDMLEAVQTGKATPLEGLGWLEKTNKWKADHAKSAADFADWHDNQTFQSSVAKDMITSGTNSAVQSMFDAYTVNIGTGNVRFQELAEKHARGEDIPISQEQWDKMGQDIEQRLLAIRQQQDAVYRRPTFNPQTGTMTGRSPMQAAGDDYQKTLDNSMALGKHYLEKIKDHDLGSMYETKRNIEGMNNAATYTALKDPNVAPMLLMSKAFKDAGGDNMVVEYLNKIRSTSGGFRMPDEESIKTLMKNMATNSHYKGFDGMTQSLKTVIDENKDHPSPASVSAMVNYPPAAIGDNKLDDPSKINIINKVFSEKEQGFLNQIQRDYTDAKGNPIQGRTSVYAYYGTPRVAQEIKRLSDTYDPKIWTNYQSWMYNSFARDIYGPDLKELKSIPKEPGMIFKFNTPSDKTKAPSFTIDYDPIYSDRGQGSGPFDAVGQQQKYLDAYNRLSRINRGIEALHNVIGENTGAKLLEVMRANGIDPGDSSNLAGSLLLSMKPKKIEGFKKNQSQAGE